MGMHRVYLPQVTRSGIHGWRLRPRTRELTSAASNQALHHRLAQPSDGPKVSGKNRKWTTMRFRARLLLQLLAHDIRGSRRPAQAKGAIDKVQGQRVTAWHRRVWVPTK